MSYGLLLTLRLVESTPTYDKVELSGSIYHNGFPDYELRFNNYSYSQFVTPWTGPGPGGLSVDVIRGAITPFALVVPK